MNFNGLVNLVLEEKEPLYKPLKPGSYVYIIEIGLGRPGTVCLYKSGDNFSTVDENVTLGSDRFNKYFPNGIKIVTMAYGHMLDVVTKKKMPPWDFYIVTNKFKRLYNKLYYNPTNPVKWTKIGISKDIDDWNIDRETKGAWKGLADEL